MGFLPDIILRLLIDVFSLHELINNVELGFGFLLIFKEILDYGTYIVDWVRKNTTSNKHWKYASNSFNIVYGYNFTVPYCNHGNSHKIECTKVLTCPVWVFYIILREPVIASVGLNFTNKAPDAGKKMIDDKDKNEEFHEVEEISGGRP